MANAEHIGWLREDVASWNKRRERNPFSPDLSSEDIPKQLGGHECEDIHQPTVDLKGINLSGANLNNATLRNADLTGAVFDGSNFIEAILAGSDFTRARFVNGSLRGTKLWSANLTDAKFWSVPLPSAQLGGANLKGTQFYQCNLQGAHLYNADLVGANFVESRPWTALLFFPSQDEAASVSFDRESINGVDDLLNGCREFKEGHGDDIVLYFRGESRCYWDLRPSVMRFTEGKAPFRPVEVEMFNDLMIREPEAFNGLGSALAQWVLAQHHGLKTRLLDITRNPLVALFNACDDNCKKDGRLHVFAVPRSLIKPFSSDTVSILANFAKLPRGDQNVLLGKTEKDAQGDAFSTAGQNVLEKCEGYARARRKLYALIRQERPYFEERLDIRDLFRVFVIEPQRMFERIRAQSGAFLISAFHERFERDEVLSWNTDIPIYSHYVLQVPKAQKRQIIEELQLLNVTRATLLPSVDESAKAVTRHYCDRTS